MNILTNSLFTKVMFPSHTDGLYNVIDPSCEYEGRLQLFYKVNRDMPYEMFIQILNKAGKENILDTIKLIFYLRDCRGGKGERKLGRYAYQWLSIHYPNEMLKYMYKIPYFGRWDDLFCIFPNAIQSNRPDNYCTQTIDAMMMHKIEQQAVQIVAEQLKKDKLSLSFNQKISVCSKWIPGEQTKLNIQYQIRQSLCNYMNCSLKQLRKQYITPLRKHLNLIETRLCSKHYENIKLNQLPSYTILRYKRTLSKNIPKIYSAFCKSNDMNMNTLYPYDIIKQYNLTKLPTIPDEQIEKQWSLFTQRNQFDCFKNTIPVVDVSIHMYNKPILIAYSLALLIIKCSVEPFKDLIIECNDKLECKYIPETYKLLNVLKKIPSSSSVTNTFNILKCFDIFLEKAKQNNLASHQIPNQIIFLSTMKGLQSVAQKIQDNTLLQTIDKKYKDAGFIRPRLIFFNVDGNIQQFPVLSTDSNVALVSGYSHSIFKALHYNNQDVFNPITTMKKILQFSKYVL